MGPDAPARLGSGSRRQCQRNLQAVCRFLFLDFLLVSLTLAHRREPTSLLVVASGALARALAKMRSRQL